MALTVTVACVLLLTPEPQSAVMAGGSCSASVPEPGPARPWEADIAVSTYSTVNTRTLNLFTTIPIVSWSGKGPGMNMVLYHNSANVGLPASRHDNVGFDLGPGWSIAYSDQLIFDDPVNPTQITVVQDNGRENVFTLDAATQEWVPPKGVYDKLTFESTCGGSACVHGSWIVTHKDQSWHDFRRDLVLVIPGIEDEVADGGIFRLAEVVDSAGQAVTLTYERVGTSMQFRIQKILAAGRNLLFIYDAYNGRLQSIQDPAETDEGGTLGVRTWNFTTIVALTFCVTWRIL